MLWENNWNYSGRMGYCAWCLKISRQHTELDSTLTDSFSCKFNETLEWLWGFTGAKLQQPWWKEDSKSGKFSSVLTWGDPPPSCEASCLSSPPPTRARLHCPKAPTDPACGPYCATMCSWSFNVWIDPDEILPFDRWINRLIIPSLQQLQ